MDNFVHCTMCMYILRVEKHGSPLLKPNVTVPEQNRQPLGTFNYFNFNNSFGGGGSAQRPLTCRRRQVIYMSVARSTCLGEVNQNIAGPPEPVGRVLRCSTFAR
jgi:hypothetical protein